MPGGDTWGRLAVAFVLIAKFFVVELVALGAALFAAGFAVRAI